METEDSLPAATRENRDQPFMAPAWEVIDARGHPWACFFEADEAFKVARYLLVKPGQVQAMVV